MTRGFWLALATGMASCVADPEAIDGPRLRASAEQTSEPAVADASAAPDAALDESPPDIPVIGGTDAGSKLPKSDGGWGSPPSPPTCSLSKSGSTGRETAIPVCCTPANATDAAGGADLVSMLAAYRAENGRGALTVDARLAAAAQGHCEHMRVHGFFSHFAPEPVVYSVFLRAPLCGAIADGEVLAYFFSAAEAMAFWKGSPAHNDILLGTWRRVGAARASGYWALVFGR
jgi:uncharacterized protein YkwD